MSESIRLVLFFSLMILGIWLAVHIGRKFTTPIPKVLLPKQPQPLGARIAQGSVLIIAAPLAIAMLIFIALYIVATGSFYSYSVTVAWIMIFIGIPVLILLFLRIARKIGW